MKEANSFHQEAGKMNTLLFTLACILDEMGEKIEY